MAMPTVRVTAQISNGSSTASTTDVGTIPASSLDGDLAVLVASQGTGANTCATPTGWTLVGGPLRVDANISAYVFAKDLVLADAGASVSLVWSGGAKSSGVIVVLSGADTVAELVSAALATAANGTVFNIPSVTTVEADCAILAVAVLRDATATPPDATWPGTWTSQVRSATGGSTPNLSCEAATVTAGALSAGVHGGGTGGSAGHTGALAFTVGITPAPAANVPPTANAGVDQTGIAPGATVALSGSDSDSDGTVATRAWTQLSGASVALSGAATANASFTAPSDPAGWTGTFRYTVTDNAGATGFDDVSITVLADDGGLRIYRVDATGTKLECNAYRVDATGTKLQFADKV